jgi:hypothetical protein
MTWSCSSVCGVFQTTLFALFDFACYAGQQHLHNMVCLFDFSDFKRRRMFELSDFAFYAGQLHLQRVTPSAVMSPSPTYKVPLTNCFAHTLSSTRQSPSTVTCPNSHQQHGNYHIGVEIHIQSWKHVSAVSLLTWAGHDTH